MLESTNYSSQNYPLGYFLDQILNRFFKFCRTISFIPQIIFIGESSITVQLILYYFFSFFLSDFCDCTIQFLRRKLVKMVEISAMLATHVRMDWGLIVIGKQFTMWMPTESRIVLEIVFSFTYCSVYSPAKKKTN